MFRTSLFAYCLVVGLVLLPILTTKDSYDKNTQRAFTFDSMGYYLYLPAYFIYDDIAHCRFLDTVVTPRYPASASYLPEKLPNGNVLNKYAIGQAVFQLPWFGLAHLVAPKLGYPVDGFSPPYHTIVSFGNIFVGLLALWFLRRLLLRYFPDSAVALSLLLLLVATNYWCYISYNSHMTHASLFALFVVLLWHTIRWHEQPTWWSSLVIGGVVGFAMLMRPTDVMCVLVPLLWRNENQTFAEKYQLFRQNIPMLVLATLVGGIIVFLQLWYWKTVTGSWVYYSYGDATLEFLNPHITKVLYSYKKGWLVYTPVMVFALWGFGRLYRTRRHAFWAIFVYFIVHFYLVSAWSVWWYGGSFGQRALIQLYAFLMLPFAAFWTYLLEKRWIWVIMLPVLGFMIWLNVTQTFLGILDPEGNTRTYFWHVFGKAHVALADRKYLQVDEKFTKKKYNTHTLFETDFRTDSLLANAGMLVDNPIQTSNAHCLDNPQTPLCSPVLSIDSLHRRTRDLIIPLSEAQQKGWIRLSMNAAYTAKDWAFWQNHVCYVSFYNGDKEVKSAQLRPATIIDLWEWTPVSFETQIPTRKAVTHIAIHVGDGGTPHALFLDDWKVEWLY